jgi:hypothetical protein
LSAPCLLATAWAQEPTYQPEEEYSVKLKVDALLRQEWTRSIFVSSTATRDESRRRGRLLPRLEFGIKRLLLGVGGDFNFSSDKNTDPKPALLRDNYKSRDARLDLAFASFKPADWFQVQGGRFAMPLALTEMIWDRDLRPQGGALTLATRDHGSLERLALTGLVAKGSHVFEDDPVKMYIGSLDATFKAGEQSKLQLTASYVTWTDFAAGLEGMIRRQNTRVVGAPAPAPLARDYKVVDVVARLRHEGELPSQLVANYCRNTAIGQDNQGLWLAVVLGSTQTSRSRLEYTYAKVDKDATLAAYAEDDFFWSTGWEGHRGDLGLRASDHTALHGIGQLQRFKDSPRPEEREHWVKRFRVELRINY